MKKKTILLYNQLIKEFEKKSDKEHLKRDQYYHKYAGYKSYGIRAPLRNAILKRFKGKFAGLNERESIGLVQQLYFSHVEEQMLAGNYILALHKDLIAPQKFGWLDRMMGYFRSWSAVDNFCVDVLRPVLLKYPRQILALLKRWNKSKNMWKRRASAVAFVRKIGESGKFTDMVLQLCDNLKWDSEDLVRKGVGWALKDNMRGNKKKVLRYVKALRRKGVSSTIVLYAIRDLKGKERAKVLNVTPAD